MTKTLRRQIQAEFYALYSVNDLMMFHKIKSFWKVLKISFFAPVYEITCNYIDEIVEVVCPQKRFIQRQKPV